LPIETPLRCKKRVPPRNGSSLPNEQAQRLHLKEATLSHIAMHPKLSVARKCANAAVSFVSSGLISKLCNAAVMNHLR
jgi:hypothetical protein